MLVKRWMYLISLSRILGGDRVLSTPPDRGMPTSWLQFDQYLTSILFLGSLLSETGSPPL
jgi:hypothetical protein